jgi:phosphomannomutase
MHVTQKSISTIIDNIYQITGSFYYERWDLHIEENQKNKIIEKCKNNPWDAFGEYNVVNIESIDGFKFHFEQKAWTMLRLSGTEPVLRIYAEASTQAEVLAILQTVKNTVLA